MVLNTFLQYFKPIPDFLRIYQKKCQEQGFVFDPIQHQTLKILESFFKSTNKKGCYLFGPVGRGKTFLMDVAFEHLNNQDKKRFHFVGFMQFVHQGIRQTKPTRKHSSLEKFCTSFSKELSYLFLDELQVTEIADALLIYRLWSELLKNGVRIISTSNQAPESLYKGGLHYELFRPFVDILIKDFEVVPLQGLKDYRRARLSFSSPSYFSPHCYDSLKTCEDLFQELSKEHPIQIKTLQFLERSLTLQKTAGRVVWVDFDDLCRKPLAEADYSALAEHFDVLFLLNIPVFTAQDIEAAKRFMVLIDIFYDQRKRLVMTASTQPDQLYQDPLKKIPFERTISRLTEMRSWTQAYREQA